MDSHAAPYQVAQSQEIDIKIIYWVQWYLQLEALFINALTHILSVYTLTYVQSLNFVQNISGFIPHTSLREGPLAQWKTIGGAGGGGDGGGHTMFTFPMAHKIGQPRTQGITYGKDPGWGWSRDFTKIDWLKGEGRVSNCMLPQKTLHFSYKEWIRVSDLNYISSFLRYMVRNAC